MIWKNIWGLLHIPPMRAKTAKEHLIDTLADPPLDQINSSEVPLLWLWLNFKVQLWANMCNNLSKRVAKGKKENKKLKDTLNVVASKRDELQLAEKVQNHEVKMK